MLNEIKFMLEVSRKIKTQTREKLKMKPKIEYKFLVNIQRYDLLKCNIILFKIFKNK
jgi:hypothetical protein